MSNLESALNGTGRIADTKLRSSGMDKAAPAPSKDKGNDPVVQRIEPPARDDDDEAAQAAAPAQVGETDLRYRRAEPYVERCRIEVARRRQVPAARVKAGTVTLRWTIEATGRARNAEAVSAGDTDLEVAACAKRVITEWQFAKPASGAAVNVEWTYRFP